LPEAKGGVISPEFRGCSEGPSPVSELEMMHVVWLLGYPDGPLASYPKPKDLAAARKTL
jgi:hypothetical protein